MAEHQQIGHPMLKAVTAATAGGSLLVLSGVVLALTVIALTVATPVLVIFSPVLVPAAIAVFLLGSGFVTSGGLGLAAMSVLSWMYRYMTGKHPPGAEQLDEMLRRITSKARNMKESVQQQLMHLLHQLHLIIPFTHERAQKERSIDLAMPEHQQQEEQIGHPVVKAATAGGSLLVLSGVVLALMTVVAPVFVIFSPVLVPAAIAVFLVGSGFVTFGGLGLSAMSVLSWMYRFLTGKHYPPGAEQLDEMRRRIMSKVREVKESAQQWIELGTQG